MEEIANTKSVKAKGIKGTIAYKTKKRGSERPLCGR